MISNQGNLTFFERTNKTNKFGLLESSQVCKVTISCEIENHENVLNIAKQGFLLTFPFLTNLRTNIMFD